MKKILILFLIWAFLCGSSWSLTSAYHPSSKAEIESVLVGVDHMDKVDVTGSTLKAWAAKDDYAKWQVEEVFGDGIAKEIWYDANLVLYQNNIDQRIKVVKLYRGKQLLYHYNAGSRVWPNYE